MKNFWEKRKNSHIFSDLRPRQCPANEERNNRIQEFIKNTFKTEAKEKRTIYFIRHAESELNKWQSDHNTHVYVNKCE